MERPPKGSSLLLDLKEWRTEFLEELDNRFFNQPPIPERRLDRELAPIETAERFDKKIESLRGKYSQRMLREIHCAVICATFEEIKEKSEKHSYYNLARYAYIHAHRYMCKSYLRSRRKRLLLRWPAYFAWGLTSGFGQSPFRWALSVIALVLLFAVYNTPTPHALEPIARLARGLRPQLTHKSAGRAQVSPSLTECVYYSSNIFVGLTDEDLVPVNASAKTAAIVEAGSGLVMFVVLGHLLSMRITGRLESLF